MEKFGILGAGGMARELAAFSSGEVDFFAVDKKFIRSDSKNLIDISIPSEDQLTTPVVAALGAPAVRMTMINNWPGDTYTSIVDKNALVYERVDIGEGVIIAPQAIITTDVEIGSHTIINIGATISHDCKIGKFVTVSPGAHIAGNVELGDGVFIGIGAIVSNNVKIAEGVVVGAGAVVTKDITQPRSVVVGIPAKTIRINKDWMNEV